MTDQKKLNKKETAKQATRDLMINFLAREFSAAKVAKKTADQLLAKIAEKLADDSSIPALADSPDLLIVRHPFTLNRQHARKATK